MNSNRQRRAAQRRQATFGRTESPVSRPDFVAVARLRRPHGLHGEVIAEVMSGFPERIQPEAVFYLGSERKPVIIKSVRGHNEGFLVSFEEISSREAWVGKRNLLLYARAEELPALEEGEYYHHELIGLRVSDLEGRLLGQVSEILETGANDVYVVEDGGGREVLIPATTGVVKEINLEQKMMLIEPIPGLLDD